MELRAERSDHEQVLALKRRLDGAINTAKSLFGLKSFVSGDESRVRDLMTSARD